MLPEKNPNVTPIKATPITHPNADKDSGALLSASGRDTLNASIPPKSGNEPAPPKWKL
jgi:hypothetical protein